MSAILPFVKIDLDRTIAKHFLPYQINWIEAEDSIHAQNKKVFALAEKSARIGWTESDSFKNVRKRIRFPKRDYLFVTRDLPSALEYVNTAYGYAELFDLTGSILTHDEQWIELPRVDATGRSTGSIEKVKAGVIKFDNGSRIIAFSANPQAMAVYGGDVGLDEFAKHPNPELLWETAQARITWEGDIAVWSSHCGDDTLFYQFCQEARAGKGPWNLYYRVTMPDAIELGLVEVINRSRGSNFSREQFLSDCRKRANSEQIYQQTYLCNPVPGGASLVEWSAIERCRSNYTIERQHLEHAQILELFGECLPHRQHIREDEIIAFIRQKFPILFASPKLPYRLGFDIAASGEGDLGVLYIDEAKGPELWLRALLSTRTEDWHFLKTALRCFMRDLPSCQAAGDETGLGRQICWETAQQFRNRFFPVNFASKKHDLGFSLMNQLSVAEKRFPVGEPDIAADYFALRKNFAGKKWIFSEGRNNFNEASHCDIAWAGALATEANNQKKSNPWAHVG